MHSLIRNARKSFSPQVSNLNLFSQGDIKLGKNCIMLCYINMQLALYSGSFFFELKCIIIWRFSLKISFCQFSYKILKGFVPGLFKAYPNDCSPMRNAQKNFPLLADTLNHLSVGVIKFVIKILLCFIEIQLSPQSKYSLFFLGTKILFDASRTRVF